MGSLVLGKIRGNMWYVGDGITGSSTTPAVFPDSGVSKAYVGDMYLHLESADDDNGHVYQCTLKGDAETAKWVYTGSILGPMPELCDDLDSTSITKAATANAIRRLKDLIDNAGIYPLAMDFNYDEEAYSTTLTIENVSTTISITDSDGNVGTYSYTASGSTEEANVTINIGEDIGYESEGAIVTHIASSVAVIKNAKLYGSDGLICDITPDMWGAVNDLNAEIKPGATISGGSGADAYSYRAGNIFKKIGGVITQLFPVTHAKAVWMDKVNGNTVHHEITTLQSILGTTIGDLAKYVLTGTKPSSAITAGEYFVDKDDAFRKANSNISTTTDIDNTNSSVTTVGEELTELNSNLGSKSSASAVSGATAFAKISTLFWGTVPYTVVNQLSDLDTYIGTLVSMRPYLALISNDGSLIVGCKFNNNYQVQLLMNYNTGKMQFRTHDVSSWGSWQTVAFTN